MPSRTTKGSVASPSTGTITSDALAGAGIARSVAPAFGSASGIQQSDSPMVATVLDVLEGAAITLLAATILHHCWTHTQALKSCQPTTEADVLYDALDAFYRGKGTWPEREIKVRAALAAYEQRLNDGAQ